MAKSVNYGNIPVDQLIPRNVKESDMPGADHHWSLPPESPERAKKGDLGETKMKDFDSKALSHDGVPWKNLKSGKSK